MKNLYAEIKSGVLSLRSFIAKNSLLLIQEIYSAQRSTELLEFTNLIIGDILERMPAAKHFLYCELQKCLENISLNAVFEETALIFF